jgi:DNA-directed RNA polymerase specialized sigma24 family protein
MSVTVSTEELLDQIVRLLAIQVRQGFETQNAAILALNSAGFSNARVGELLGTTTDTVRSAVNAAKK